MFCRLLVEAAITIITKVPIKNLILYSNILAKALSLYIREIFSLRNQPLS